MERLGRFFIDRPVWVLGLVLAALAGLPLALWQDMDALSDNHMERQTQSMNAILSAVRAYYAENVVDPVKLHDGNSLAMHNYRETPGAIPIPATLSIELGQLVADAEEAVTYRFVSDFPFMNRTAHELSPLERQALETFRTNPETREIVTMGGTTFFDHTLTLATPILMEQACVDCHNAHPESTHKDWAVGDVRGVQSVTINQPIASNLWAFRWMLTYLALAGTAGLVFTAIQFRLARSFSQMNNELAANNSFLADVSLKISKYLPPQVYRSIFSGEKDVTISTERKKLTVFFSDIKDFTATTELLQPEELTELLNEYFTEMSKIAESHGATIDKFIGDAIVAFFGDPTTKGTAEDARACVRMALEMQARLDELDSVWRAKGLEHPFRARMGINTGYCNVGNFGSDARMDYTIIGAEANLAARLEGIAEPGGIVMSYETYAHVRNLIEAEALEPTRFKGIARDITPYRVLRKAKGTAPVPKGDKLVVDLEGMSETMREKVAQAVQEALHKTQDAG